MHAPRFIPFQAQMRSFYLQGGLYGRLSPGVPFAPVAVYDQHRVIYDFPFQFLSMMMMFGMAGMTSAPNVHQVAAF
jgi:hypothetical protein